MPQLWMFVWPNGSGKSTITSEFQQRPGFPSEYINPDILTQQLAGDGTSYLERSRRAQQIAVEQRQSLIANKTSFGFETVMSHPSKVAILHQAKKAGYDINLVFVCTKNPDINVARVASRVRAGGHDVSTDKVVARYHRSLNLLPSAIEISDYAVVFDNSENYSTKARFERGQLSELEDSSPDWPIRISNEVTQRREEKQALIASSQAQGAGLRPADINAGNYSGRIIKNSNCYAVQELKNNRCVLHDLKSVKVAQNATARIKYLQRVFKVQLNERSSGMEL